MTIALFNRFQPKCTNNNRNWHSPVSSTIVVLNQSQVLTINVTLGIIENFEAFQNPTPETSIVRFGKLSK